MMKGFKGSKWNRRKFWPMMIIFSIGVLLCGISIAEASSQCREYDATLQQHENANRAYSVVTGIWIFQKTTWYAIGSDENLGTNGSIQAVLKEDPVGYFETGNCPKPVAPVIDSVEVIEDISEITIFGSASDGDNDISVVEVRFDNSQNWSVVSGTESWSYKTSTLSYGDHEVFVRATDDSGLISDVVGPVQFTVYSPNEESDPVIETLNVDIHDNTATIDGTAFDSDGDLENIFVRVNDGTWFLATGTTNWSFTIELEPGEYIFSAQGVDRIGNLSNIVTSPSYTIEDQPQRCIEASNREHVQAGRAYTEKSWNWTFYYATGSGVYLGTSGDMTTILEERGLENWTPVENCSVVPAIADYLIITADELYDAAMNLHSYRKNLGHNVSIVKVSEIAAGDVTADKIDAWVETYVSTNRNLKYIVFVGDYMLLPGFEENDRDDIFFHDLKYVIDNDVYETNYVPDIAFGRIPARDSNELNQYIGKIAQFEDTISSRNMVAIFHDTQSGLYVDRDLQKAVDVGYETLNIGAPASIGDLYTPLNDNASEIALVFFHGHGTLSGNYWLTSSNLSTWKNNDFPVIYFSGGCDFNNYTTATRPLAAELLFNNYGSGSVASISNAVNGGYGYSYYLSEIFIRHSKESNTIGEMMVSSMREYYETCLAEGQDFSPGSWNYILYRRMMLSGDPGIRLR